MSEKLKEEQLFCVGCGALLQTQFADRAGYIPSQQLEKYSVNPDAEILCQRCFRLRNYNEIQPVELTDNDFTKVINRISEDRALVILVVDIFDVAGTLISGLNRIVGNNNPILVVGNKEDLIPKSVKRSKLKDWLRRQAENYGIRPIDISLISSIKNTGLDQLLDKVENLREHRNVYFVGTTNVGKSTIINQILSSKIGIKNLVTTSRFAGTTLDMIKIPLEDNAEMVDTPGLINRGQIIHQLNADQLKLITPTSEIRPRTYQLNADQSIFIGGLARFDFTHGQRSGFTFYFANQLDLHRTKTIKSEAFFEKHGGVDLRPKIEDLVNHFEFKTDKQPIDLSISGLGWIHLPANVVVNIQAVKNVDITLRESIIG